MRAMCTTDDDSRKQARREAARVGSVRLDSVAERGGRRQAARTVWLSSGFRLGLGRYRGRDEVCV